MVKTTTCGLKTVVYLKHALSALTVINLFLLIIPFTRINESRKKLKDLDLISGSSNLFRPYFADQIFDTLYFACWFSFIFLALGAFIHAKKCHHRETKFFENPCPPSSLDDPVHTLRPILLFYVIIILCCALLQIAFGIYILTLTPDEGVKELWLEDSNLAEARRTLFINQNRCCGWFDVFEYQLQPECSKSELIALPKTCRDTVQDLLNKWIRPVGSAVLGVGFFELIGPWAVMVALNTLDRKVEVADTSFDARDKVEGF